MGLKLLALFSQIEIQLSRPEGAVGIIWVYISVYIGIIVRNDSALRAGKKLNIYLCVAYT